MGGDLGESTYGRRWVFRRFLRELQIAALTAQAEPERLSGRISSGPAAPNRPLSLPGFADLAYSGRERSFEQ